MCNTRENIYALNSIKTLKKKNDDFINIFSRIDCFDYLQNYPLIVESAVQFLDGRKPDLQIHV